MEEEKAIVILSGGLDSTVSLYDTVAKGIKVVGVISFDYGQKHVKELTYAKKTCEKLGLEHKIIDLQILSPLLESSLTRSEIEVPEGQYQEENMKSTVVPNRNMIMSAIAAGWAMTLKANYIILGVHQGDHAIYPDCRIEFIEKLNEVIKIADWNKVEILTPVLNLDKGGVVALGLTRNVPFEDTWTCYKGGEKPCGKCGSCQERNEAFEKNGMTDPLLNNN